MMAKARAAHHQRRHHVFLVLLDQRRAAHGARVGGPVRQADRDDQHDDRRLLVILRRDQAARDAEHEKRDQDRRKRELDIGDAHDERIGAAADIAGHQAERDADRDREHHRGKADQQRHARAEKDRREHVAALIVGAEQEHAAGHGARLARLGEAVHQVERGGIEGILRRDPRREDRGEQQDQNDSRSPGSRPANGGSSTRRRCPTRARGVS